MTKAEEFVQKYNEATLRNRSPGSGKTAAVRIDPRVEWDDAETKQTLQAFAHFTGVRWPSWSGTGGKPQRRSNEAWVVHHGIF